MSDGTPVHIVTGSDDGTPPRVWIGATELRDVRRCTVQMHSAQPLLVGMDDEPPRWDWPFPRPDVTVRLTLDNVDLSVVMETRPLTRRERLRLRVRWLWYVLRYHWTRGRP